MNLFILPFYSGGSLYLMLFHHLNVSLPVSRDLRRSGSSPVKTEGERSPVGQGPPKSCVDVKSERTHDGQEQHSTVEKPKLFSESAVAVIIYYH